MDNFMEQPTYKMNRGAILAQGERCLVRELYAQCIRRENWLLFKQSHQDTLHGVGQRVEGANITNDRRRIIWLWPNPVTGLTQKNGAHCAPRGVR